LVARVVVTVRIAAPAGRVWNALTVPSQVRVWDGVTPLDVPEGYPEPGQHACWITSVGPFRLTLHDRVRAVDPGVRLASSIDVAFVHVDEEYRLEPAAPGVELISDNEVRSSVPALGRLARRLTRANVETSMARLKAFCEGSPFFEPDATFPR
jgi:uncharacterized protein YndB with AHSA1/START domain